MTSQYVDGCLAKSLSDLLMCFFSSFNLSIAILR
jgi:hypothetical protein